VSRSGSVVTVTAPRGDDLKKLLDRAQAGDNSALPRLRAILKDPGAVDALGGDLARDAQARLIDKYAGQNHMLRESLLRKLELLRAEVAGPSPSPLERLLTERILSCWLHLHRLEAIYNGTENLSLDFGEYYQRNIQRAQKNYLAAIKALATIRRLALPSLQVNIARRQVNVLAAPAAGDDASASCPTTPGTVGTTAGRSRLPAVNCSRTPRHAHEDQAPQPN
jgi:hypothetical protein